MREPVKLGDYYLFDRVAVGGMAEVFKAVSYGVEGFERLFAIKRVLPNIAEDQEFVEMFVDEAKIAVQLHHANIGQIYELGKVDGTYFIAMELVQGRDLRTIFDLAQKGYGRPEGGKEHLDIAMCCYAVIEVCEALEYAHNKRRADGEPLNLIHRDVSPQNIICSYDGEVKLVDFGIAKATGKANQTQAGILKGKFGYMSPEQVRGRTIDRRTDVFSLAVVLYELLTLERCFQGESDFSTLDKVRKVDIRQPREINRQIPPALEQIMLKGLAREPEDRYQSAAELQEALQKYLYSTGEFYARKELSRFMRARFSADYDRDQARLLAFREYARQHIPEAQKESAPVVAARPAPPAQPARPPALPNLPPPLPIAVQESAPAAVSFQPSAPSMDWEDEELETAIWDRSPSQVGPAPAAPRGPSAPPAMPADPPAFARAAQGGQPFGQPSATPPFSQPAYASRDQATVNVRHEEKSRGHYWLFAALALLVISAVAWFLRPDARLASLYLEVEPAQVQLSLNGEPAAVYQSPIELTKLAPGHYAIQISSAGYQPVEQSFDLQAGEHVRLDPLVLSRAVTGLEIDTQPGGAKVYIDDELVEETPMRTVDVRPGVRRLRLEKAGYLSWNGTVEALSGTIRRVEKITLYPAQVTVTLMAEPKEAVLFAQQPGGTPVRLGAGVVRYELDNRGQTTISAKLEGYETAERRLDQYTQPNPERPELFELRALEKPVAQRVPAAPASEAPPAAIPSEAPPARRPAATRTPARPAARTERPAAPARRGGDCEGEDCPPPARPASDVVVVHRTPASSPPPVTVERGPGFLNLQAKPPAQAFIGGRMVGWTPLIRYELPPGNHEVELVREGEGAYRRTIRVIIESGKTTLRKFEP